ncbi:MAG: winged helix-turn-helix domain-containing protein, partial [Collimonas pratensis]|uniref:winged helix-turn-helix domain-containing protein n=1 Tax=Collimonas pratensis TaxID=279113 RepID=UPI003C72E867
VQALLRRSYPSRSLSGKMVFDDYVFEMEPSRLSLRGNAIAVTSKEFNLALLLFQNINRTISRSHIFGAVWGSSTDAPSRTLDIHITRVRKKLGLFPENGYDLYSIYNYGYRLIHMCYKKNIDILITVR